jgi:hypothetical protein
MEGPRQLRCNRAHIGESPSIRGHPAMGGKVYYAVWQYMALHILKRRINSWHIHMHTTTYFFIEDTVK